MNFKHAVAIGVPALAAAVAVTILTLSNLSKANTISRLRAEVSSLQDDGNPDGKETVYEPTDVTHFYNLRGHKLFLSDTTYGQIWIPLLEDVTLSTHPVENMKELTNGRVVSFGEDGTLDAMTGVDISSHNEVTDWNAVKADGIDFVMLRIGYRNYGIGADKMNPDNRFREYYEGAKAAGLLVGAYFFSQAVTEEEAVAEAVYTAELLEGCPLDFPVVFDWEIIFHDAEGARTDNVPVDTLTDCVLAYCQNMESFGYQAMYYQNKRTALWKLDLPRLESIPMWIAEYGDGPTYPYDYDMWQYSSKGKVAGIEGEVDLDLSFRDFSKEGAPAVSLPADGLPPVKDPNAPAEADTGETHDAFDQEDAGGDPVTDNADETPEVTPEATPEETPEEQPDEPAEQEETAVPET